MYTTARTRGRGPSDRPYFAFMRRGTIALAASLAIAGVSVAQDEYDETLEEIVVTATRTERLLSETPGNVSVLTREDIQAKGDVDVSAAVDEISGVRVLSYGGVGATSSAHIRGTYGAHTLVLVDGRVQNTPSQGSADLSGLSPAFVERIEVVRGPSSALYGAGAVGGLVQVFTRDVPGEPIREFDAFLGTFDTLGATFLAGAPFGLRGACVFGVHGFRTDGHRPNSEAESVELFGKLRLGEVESGSVIVTLGYKDSFAGWPGARPAAALADRDDNQLAFGTDEVSSLVDHGGATRSYIQAEYRRIGFRARASLDRTEDDTHQHSMRWVWVGPLPGDYALHHFVQDRSLDTMKPSFDIDASWTPNDGLRVSSGASVEYDRFRVATTEADVTVPATTLSGRVDERTTTAAWAQAELGGGPWQGIVGVRWDEPSDYDGKASVRLVGAWKNDAGLRVEVGAGTAFRAPSLNDLNWPADFWSAGNPDLKPENAFEADVSVKWRVPGSDGPRASATIFSKSVEDMIAWAPDSGGIWTPTNLNDVNIRGAEVSLDTPLGHGLRLRTGYSLLDSHEKGPRITQVDWNPFPADYTYTEVKRDTAYTPNHQFDLALEWSARAGTGTLTTSLSAGWRSKVRQYYETWTDIGGNITEVTYPIKEFAALWLVGLRVGWSVKKGEVFVRVDNLLGTEYATQFGFALEDRDFPMPGRSVTVGTKITF